VLGLGRERGEDFVALAVAEHADVQLVMMAAEVGELRLLRDSRPVIQGLHDRLGAPAGMGEPLRGASAEIEQHLHAVSAVQLEVLLAVRIISTKSPSVPNRGSTA
jgi:hypothetical protein